MIFVIFLIFVIFVEEKGACYGREKYNTIIAALDRADTVCHNDRAGILLTEK